jgi:hypothetical protein
MAQLLLLMKAVGGRKSKGKAHGGQAGFSIEKTREIVEQWPNFPYYVPPASKTGPKLNNPRSRVHIPTEGNGMPFKSIRRKKGGVIPAVVGVIAKQAIKQGIKQGIKEGVKGSVKQYSDAENKAAINKYYCHTRARQGIKDPLCGGAKKKAKKPGKPKYDVI